ncbi:YceD family protein [Tateyamaria sp. SN3-11]|uniref:YceD family protein n=1 Tax=Tateyamaria sp. SN3-11 TaxID=3092147 RepID=UPI0039E92D0B
MPKTPPSSAALRVADLAQNAGTAFEIVPDAAQMAAIAEVLDLSGLRKLRFVGEVSAQGRSDWVLTASLGATVTQPCAVTLAPVTTRIDVPVRRQFVTDWVEAEEGEVEMPEDDTIEPLGNWIDPEAVMIEALSLAVPDYPRAEGVALGETVLAGPGVVALTDDDLRPFAGLADLKSKMEGKDDT